MNLGQRLVLGALAVVSVLVLALAAIAGDRLRERLTQSTFRDLEREARLAAASWTSRADPDSLADAMSALLGVQVTLIDSAGRVVGDSEFDGPALLALPPAKASPEVGAARRGETGRARETGSLAVAIRSGQGVVRATVDTRRVEEVANGARRDIVFAGSIAAIVAMLLALAFARSISRPVVELSAVARAISAGDLARRPTLAAPGEVGELAAALHRMAELLANRLAALERDDALTTALLESLDEGVLAVDSRARVIRANASARALLGIRDEVPFSADRLPRDAVLRAALADALSGRAADDTELRLGERTLLLTARPLREGGAVLALLDLTAMRRLEAVRRDFVANVSHELKTPLTVIGGFAETLADDDPPPDQRRRFVEAIRTNAQRMQRLVDDLLDLSRIESGGWQPNVARVDVRAVLTDTATAIEQTAARKGVRVLIDIQPGAEEVSADPLAVRQVVSNLAENAVRHTMTGSATLFARRHDGGVDVGVRDTGTGIAPEHLPRIFERFYRADPSRSRAEGGTGLGLAIVKHLVEAHGGRVTAASTLGKGTEVVAHFPTRS